MTNLEPAQLMLGAEQDRLQLGPVTLVLKHSQGPLAQSPKDWDHWLALRMEGDTLPLLHGEAPAHPFAPCPARLGFYPVVPDASWLPRLLDLGVGTVQLRFKGDPSAAERQVALAVKEAQGYKARLFVNDHWQAALHHGAYGVHLGQEDLLSADLERLSLSGIHLGLSSHGLFEQARALSLRPSYIAFGAIFPTTTKDMPSAPQGLDKLKAFCHRAGATPTVAIGGIDLDNAAAVLAQGPGSLAVVRAVTESGQLKTEVGRWLALCGG
ncbi:thiamin-phosphate pyrophosphorylase, ThiE [Gallaecimonas xiamenensis 3-C-1]|uniref:Thiamin-phosphate pyrophosphorylase, ThiE n=2 Tax=Gallaecimonas TaxID=745410 RepID=K2IX84_9GAMM|nr:thiamine phosphate synthase [Gallaecimonas xiamenensis]EKE67237.1 thiamin-phosphate pyrophosphorylase, ThiE [Gallaecimonas xiamenensis 3-C-1]